MSNDLWTVKAALDWCQGYLERKNDPHARLSAQWLLSYATGLERIEVYTHFDQPLSPEERDTLRCALRRRGAGEPLQYIMGTAPFRHIELHVEQGVLIPRPETEMLVETAVSALGARAEKSLRAADVCTGSGCIACSLADEHPTWRIWAGDISPDAVRIAGENVERLGFSERVSVCAADLLEGADGPFDVIISNPPYIPDEVMRGLPSEVADFEPELALAGGADGLDIFRTLAVQALGVLAPAGVFACELHETCLDAAASIAREDGFSDVRIECDLTGRPRILLASAPADASRTDR